MKIAQTLCAIAVGLLAVTAWAGGSSPAQQAAVEDLPVCYARGTDALGRAVGAVDTLGDLDSTANLGDPDFAAALELYRGCFAKDFSFTLAFDGAPVLTVPDPATRTPDTDAALQWANFVNNAFRGPGYRSTQHHMGSISSDVHGGQANVVSYLIATHVYGPSGEYPAGSTRVIGGTYTDEVVHTKGQWLIQQRTLNITSNVVSLAE